MKNRKIAGTEFTRAGRSINSYRSSILKIAILVICSLSWNPLSAQISDHVIRIGFITDLSGPYAEVDGPAGAAMIRMAVNDLGKKVNGAAIEVLVSDHHNDVKAAVDTARAWFGKRKLDVLIGGVNSDVGLALAEVAKQAKKPFIAVGSGTTVHTNEQCSAYSIHYAYDTYSQGWVTGKGAASGNNHTFFLLTADYPFGLQLGKYAQQAIIQSGGKILGSATHAHDEKDFTPFIKKAQNSKASTIILANGHSEFVEAVQAINRLGLHKRLKIAGTFVFITELHDLGLAAAQGMLITDSWYWSRDDQSRAWSKRFYDQFKRMPSSLHAADYSAALQYLKAVKAIGSDDAEKVIRQLKRTRISDIYTANGHIRGDGRMIHDMYLLRVKTPLESKSPWDYYNLVKAFTNETAWISKSASGCAIWK
ncbi:branched-chain amino acid transport system substrate-binding protein [Mucilaginibacter pineti]|uniref:Branched-chain amino acid transport system substrate-binding protein n=1 Tax=Mucilaginibacter pineti TaxID=1391627 RepID=A0A1G6ZAM7_9SPHI|nr:ABC transporter substrate-binding protein [Mucilaginibacter pineti]SDD99698.1 branched-chain amino acid transport system substrate-binding protein [Mucilaginibacter pineti]